MNFKEHFFNAAMSKMAIVVIAFEYIRVKTSSLKIASKMYLRHMKRVLTRAAFPHACFDTCSFTIIDNMR